MTAASGDRSQPPKCDQHRTTASDGVDEEGFGSEGEAVEELDWRVLLRSAYLPAEGGPVPSSHSVPAMVALP
nr:hypothetical protein OG461_14560 [Streptomyces sp. NBC_00995]